ncbi:MAG: hypothetical protein KKE30_14475 [Gammaproteobacteria bacterium]|nr:hypothetical protein [Gammaproteobacteria bacterium]MBU1553419.1 hypothetical protein [Gammaproteobacteria bacterium]MBU2070975.1 hypothetical protein [Gammaproteobacteria bacterium]MBU2183801.1 hypothetical protein [Gammaproteobacteria bacterium]MBU2206500.1 hypothetical protein [Gammaproteobacteria bacterium]
MTKFLLPAMLALLLVAVPARAALIYISPVQQQVAVADTLSVDIFVSGLAGEVVSGWDLLLLFDGSILQATDVFFDLANFADDPIADALYDATISVGEVSTFMVSFLSDAELALRQTEPVRLFSVSFLALTDGVSLLNFGTDPDFELNVTGRDGLSLDLSARGACVGVGQGQCATDIPAPSTLWLFALAVLLPLSRRFSWRC